MRCFCVLRVSGDEYLCVLRVMTLYVLGAMLFSHDEAFEWPLCPSGARGRAPLPVVIEIVCVLRVWCDDEYLRVLRVSEVVDSSKYWTQSRKCSSLLSA